MSKKEFGTYKILANIIELKVLSLEKHENKMDLHTQPNEEGHDRMLDFLGEDELWHGHKFSNC